MSHLSKRKPTVKEIVNLDPFDLTFLVFTGNIKLVNPLEIVIAKLKKDGDLLLWGPEARVMTIALSKAWETYAVDLVAAISNSFDVSVEDIVVDVSGIRKAFTKYDDVGYLTYENSRAKLLQVIALIQKRSLEYYKEQFKSKADIDVILEEYLRAVDLSLAEYMLKYPEEILLPEVEKVIKIVNVPKSARTVDLATLKDRVKALDSVSSRHFGLVSDIDAGRTWHHSGIIYGDQTKATTYQVLSEKDRAVCKVCETLDGTTYSVSRQMKKINQFLDAKGKRVDELYKFPRFEEVDNRSPEELAKMDLMPPFHGRCRCELVIIY